MRYKLTLLTLTMLGAAATAHAQAANPGTGGAGGAGTTVEAVLPSSGTGPYLPPIRPGATPLSVPASTAKMSMSEAHINKQLGETTREVDARLDGLELGSGKLSGPEVDKSELQEVEDTQRQIRLLKLKQAQADLAMKLWATTYDGRKEVALQSAKGQLPVHAVVDPDPSDTPVPVAVTAAVGSASGDAGSGASGPGTGAAGTPFPVGPSAGTGEAGPAAAPAPATSTIDVAKLMHSARPVVVSITGVGDALSADLLVPYVGELDNVRAGQRLPGDMTVTAINRSGVMVKQDGQSFLLGYGGSVPGVIPASAPLSKTAR